MLKNNKFHKVALPHPLKKNYHRKLVFHTSVDSFLLNQNLKNIDYFIDK